MSIKEYIKRTATYRFYQRVRWSVLAKRYPNDVVHVPASKGEFFMNTRSWQVAPLIFQYGKGKELDYEREESKRFEEMVQKGDTVLDIGAQAGYYTLLALHAGAGKVYAFEMIHDYADEVRRQIGIYNKGREVEVVERALGQKDEELISFKNYLQKGKGKSITLDTFIEKEGVVPNVIKMDVQGHENVVLRGMKKTLEKHKPRLMVMLYEELLQERGETKREGLEIIRSAGYAIEKFANEHSYICLPKKQKDASQ